MSMEPLYEGRVPPCNIDAERSVLGAMILDDDSWAWGCENLAPALFYNPANSTIYEAMLTLKARDNVIIAQKLKELNQLGEVGGTSYITSLLNTVPTVENTEHYGHIIRDCAIRRQAIKYGSMLAETAYNGTCEETLSYAGSINDSLTGLVDTEVDTKGIAKALRRNHSATAERGFSFLQTGWPSIDKQLDGGIPLGHLTLIVGEPGSGKSMFGSNLAENWTKDGHKVLYHSLEMTKAELWSRVVGSRIYRLKMVEAKDFSYSRHILNDPKCLERHEAWGVEADDEEGWYIDDRPRITYPQILAQIRYHKRKHNISAAIVDHLGLIKVIGDKKLEYIERGDQDLITLAKELEISVVALAHRDTQSSRMENRGAKASQVKWHVSAVDGSATAFMIGDVVEVTKARFATTGIPMPNVTLKGSVATFE